CQQGYYTPFTF
nr:immunoglobulin light chain junction region [Macaca mulatta]MOV78157.1 immunoglobulin light chain junction region [Macaca mulatta]MOV79699.1 immunoglobulin light chain junction region [Macaca mulatta]MOV80651.1 immunoglobulin light chain junction region [Macaca mulatta]MOV81058.1 immunoglobulin light chain junction region [Macaca mulatta]